MDSDEIILPLEVIIHIALQMDLVELLNFCRSSSYINNSICLDNSFWSKKLLKDYNVVYNASMGTARTHYEIQYREQLREQLREQYRRNPDPNILGTISPDGTFRIFNNLRRDQRRENRGKRCEVFPRSELIDVIERLGITLNDPIMTRNELCQLIRDTLQRMGRLYFI